MVVKTIKKWIKNNTVEGLFKEGFAFAENGRFEEAIKCCDKALEINPEFEDVLSLKAGVLSELGHYEKAIEFYNKTLEINPKSQIVWLNKSIALINLDHYQEAIECCDKALETDSQNWIIWSIKGAAFASLECYEEAIECYDKVLDINSKDENTWCLKSTILNELGRYDESIECCDKALEINSGLEDAWSYKGGALIKLERYEEGIECCNEALEINPQSENAWSYKGVALIKLERYEEGIECCNKALKINPQSENTWSNKGGVLIKLDCYEEGIECCNKALEINQQSEGAWSNKSNALIKLNRYEEGIECCNKALKINPQSGSAWSNKGNALIKLERYEEGIECCNKALKINPQSENTWSYKGNALIKLESYEEGIECCNKALEIDPQYNIAKETKNQVEILGLNILKIVDIQINVPDILKVSIESPIKITVTNPTDTPIYNIQIKISSSKLIICEEKSVEIDVINANSSKYTAIFVTPRIADKIDLGYLTVSCIINGCNHEKEPIAIGTYEVIETPLYKSMEHPNDINSDLSISRETEFYQGFIRFKMSVNNTSSFVVNDVALDFDYDNNLLRIDKREPDYHIKNGRTIFGNISANSSKTIAVYFDPMMCSKGADINCQVNYKDAKGQPQTTHMKPKQISVVCPIMETESDINIGRLKEFIEKLPYRDSKVYQVQNGFDIDVLKNISREIVQKHDVKHIRTLFTKDRSICEIWYYGKTKVHGHDIVIKITILSETQNIELFAATQTVESLTGLLAEVGRELKGAIESKVTGNVQQVINVSIKDSIVQRSNLLSYCDMDGNCSGDVVIEDSLVQRSDVGTVESENKERGKEMDKDKVYDYIFNIVNNSSNIEDMNIEYKEVLRYFNQDTQSMPLLFNRLNEICRNNHERNEPLISAIVINEQPPIPGKGFFDNCMRKYRGYTGPSDGPEAEKVHNEELERVFNYWHGESENSCPACGEVVPDGAKFCMECGGKLI